MISPLLVSGEHSRKTRLLSVIPTFRSDNACYALQKAGLCNLRGFVLKHRRLRMCAADSFARRIKVLAI